MRSLAAAATLSLTVVVTTMGEPLRGQGVWTVGFNHLPDNTGWPSNPVHPASDSLPGAHPNRWITQNVVPSPTPGQRMNTVHVCLIPSGVHRGEVLVWDGNLTFVGTRAYQPWSIVNPYWPELNPNYWPGQAGTQYRFHNATLAMPVVGGVLQGELFCAGQCWLADGRLLVCGGTKSYPIQTPSDPGGFEGTKFVYQWDHSPQGTADPFGKWWQMADLEVPRWYPTVTYDGTVDHRGIVIGGTHWTQSGGTQEVNSYEVVRPVFNWPTPSLFAFPNDFDRKPLPGTYPPWPSPLPQSRRQYWGPDYPRFGDYPRIHALGILDQLSPITGGTAPRLFVSGFNAWGIRWAHDFNLDPGFGMWPGGQGFDLGQVPPNSDTVVAYGTSLLVPAPIGLISSQVARVGGDRFSPPAMGGNPSSKVDTAKVNTPSTWSTSGIPPMNHPRHFGNVVLLPTGDWFAVGGENAPGSYNLIPELLVGGTTWTDMAPHVGARDYHSAAILLPDGRVFVCGGESRGTAPDYLIWEPPYFQLSLGGDPATGIRVKNDATGVVVEQHLIGPLGMQYGQTYRAEWTNTLNGVSIDSVVLMRPAALTHHDDGGQRMVRLNAWDDGVQNTVVFLSPASELHAPPGWWMLFLVNSNGRPSQAYWVNLR